MLTSGDIIELNSTNNSNSLNVVRISSKTASIEMVLCPINKAENLGYIMVWISWGFSETSRLIGSKVNGQITETCCSDQFFTAF